MKIMLTSFGIAQDYLGPMSKYELPSVFDGMPPLDMRSVSSGFGPEYSLLVLCDKLVINESSFEQLMEQPAPLYKSVSEVMKLLRDEGFLEMADYSAVLRSNGHLLSRMTENDLKSVSQWVDSLASSVQTWQNFALAAWPTLGFKQPPEIHPLTASLLEVQPHGELRHALMRSYSPPRRLADYEHMAPLVRDILQSYLTYVNANLIISNELQVGLHDWEDFLPFYRQKFLAIGRDDLPEAAAAEASQQLFDIALPEFSVRSPRHLLALLKHKRVGELRTLINEASTGRVIFDEDFARSVFREVFGIERKLGKQRRLLGYLTLPIGYIPLVGNFAQMLLQEAAGTLLERRLTKPYRWFYMLSDLASKEPTSGS